MKWNSLSQLYSIMRALISLAVFSMLSGRSFSWPISFYSDSAAKKANCCAALYENKIKIESNPICISHSSPTKCRNRNGQVLNIRTQGFPPNSKTTFIGTIFWRPYEDEVNTEECTMMVGDIETNVTGRKIKGSLWPWVQRVEMVVMITWSKLCFWHSLAPWTPLENNQFSPYLLSSLSSTLFSLFQGLSWRRIIFTRNLYASSSNTNIFKWILKDKNWRIINIMQAFEYSRTDRSVNKTYQDRAEKGREENRSSPLSTLATPEGRTKSKEPT